MGKKRQYCPYCDVFLVHNSLRSRRDHAMGWKHICSVQAYYSRFLPQHFHSGGKPKFDDLDSNTDSTKPTVSSTSSTSSIPVQSSLLLNPITPPSTSTYLIHPPPTLGLNNKIAPPPSLKPAGPPTVSGLKPPMIGNIGPPSIRPPTIGAPGGGPPPIRPPPIGTLGGGPPPIRPPAIGAPGGGPPPIKPPSVGPPQISPIKPPVKQES